MTIPQGAPSLDEQGPGRRAALSARNAVEDVLLSLKALPVAFDREQARDRLLRAIQCAYAVMDSSVIAAAHLDGLTEGASILAETSSLLERAGDRSTLKLLGDLLDRLAAARASLLAAADEVSQIQLARRTELVGGFAGAELPPPRPFRASRGEPELHSFLRRPLLPDVIVEAAEPLPEKPAPAPPAPPPPKTIEELRAFGKGAGAAGAKLLEEPLKTAPIEEAPEPVFAYQPAIEEVEVLRRIGRDCLEDIANHRTLRKPNAIESWLDVEPFEQALLDNIDAFAAVGGAALPTVSLFFAEAKSADPERAFAVALTLGCVEGSDTVGAAVMTLKQSDPETFPGWIEGFALAPSPSVDAAMADLCTGSREDLVGLALDVLHERDATTDEVVLGLLDRDEPSIRRRVARALATALPRGEAVAELEMICAGAPSDGVFLEALEALFRRSHEGAQRLAREAVSTPTSRARAEGASFLLCLAGRAADLDLLLTELNRAPSPRLLRGLGRFGHAGSLGSLLTHLHHSDPEIVAAAAEALERITGAGLRETVEEPWPIDLPPEAEDVGAIPIPKRKVEKVIMTPEAWEAWVNQRSRDLREDIKLRAGVPFSPLHIVDELESRATPPDRRAEAALELALVTGIVSPFSPSDWVARQRRHLAALRAELTSERLSPGAWLFGALTRASERPAAPGQSSRPPARGQSSRPPAGGQSSHPPAKPQSGAPAGPALAPNPVIPAAPPLPFQPSAEPRIQPRIQSGVEPASPWASALPPEAVAAIESVPESASGVTTLPLPPIEQARAAARDPLPFKTPTPPPPAPERPADPLATTLPPETWPSRSVLPFKDPAPKPAAGARRLDQTRKFDELQKQSHEIGASAPPHASQAASLTVEQYAELFVDLESDPARAAEIRARYGLSDDVAWTIVHRTFQERFDRDPSLERKWKAHITSIRSARARS